MPEIYTLIGIIHPAACGPVEGVQFLVFSPSNKENLKNGLEADQSFYFAICERDSKFWPAGWYELSFSMNSSGKILHLPIRYFDYDLNLEVLACKHIVLVPNSINFINYSNIK
jgi:hypothetical protein